MNDEFKQLSEIDISKISQIVGILDKSSFEYLSLEFPDFRLTVGKGNLPPAALQTATLRRAGTTTEIETRTSAQLETVVSNSEQPPKPETVDSQSVPIALEEGLVEVIASIMGRFYSRPEPDAPPYVTTGAAVEADSAVGLIEVMKLFNSVNAGVDGTVVQICVEDAQFVEYGQVLMRIRPER